MPMVTVSSWTRPENWFSQPNGAYPVALKRIGASGEDGEFIDGATYEHKSELYGLKTKQSWQFQLDNGEIIEAGVAIPKEGKTSKRSTLFLYAKALTNREPVGTWDYNALIGLRALAFIQRDENDRPRITALSALEGATVGAVAPVQAPVVQAPAAQPDALPF